MDKDLRAHLFDLLKGAIGAAITAACLAGLQYLGAHIPDLLTSISVVAGGVGGVKARFG